MKIHGLNALWLAFILELGVSAQDQAVVCVQVPTDGGISQGSGVVIEDIGPAIDGWYKARIVTAAHVVERTGRADITLQFRNGKKCATCSVIGLDFEKDIAVIYGFVPNDIRPLAGIADCEIGEKVFLDGDSSRCEGTVRVKQGGLIYLDSNCIQGDSGGAIISADGKRNLIGIIQGGWIWLDGNNPRKTTWPTRAGGKQMIDQIMSGKVDKPSPSEVK